MTGTPGRVEEQSFTGWGSPVPPMSGNAFNLEEYLIAGNMVTADMVIVTLGINDDMSVSPSMFEAAEREYLKKHRRLPGSMATARLRKKRRTMLLNELLKSNRPFELIVGIKNHDAQED